MTTTRPQHAPISASSKFQLQAKDHAEEAVRAVDALAHRHAEAALVPVPAPAGADGAQVPEQQGVGLAMPIGDAIAIAAPTTTELNAGTSLESYITPDGLQITYDKHLRDAVLAAGEQMMPDLWPFFDAIEGLPLALIWGVNSNLLTADTVDKMKKRRPDMILARVPDRGHIPYLDEAEAVAALHKWIGEMQ